MGDFQAIYYNPNPDRPELKIEDATECIKNKWSDNPEKGNIDADGHSIANREKLGSK
jgi:hypothetical protein